MGGASACDDRNTCERPEPTTSNVRTLTRASFKPSAFLQPPQNGYFQSYNDLHEHEHLLGSHGNGCIAATTHGLLCNPFHTTCDPGLTMFVQSDKFDMIVAVLITINAVSVGLQVNLRALG